MLKFRYLTIPVLFAVLAPIACRYYGEKMPVAIPATVIPAPLSRTLPPLISTPLTPEMNSIRARAMLVASRLRELKFIHDVGMVKLTGWEYGSRNSEMAELLGGNDLRSLGELAVAGGMLPPGTDLATLAAAYTAVATGAVYSPLDKQIILVDKFSGDSLLTHEFVHALQDQHFDLLKLLMVRPVDFDRMEALFAVIEGDAMNVQHRSEEGASYTRRPLNNIGSRGGEPKTKASVDFPPLLTEAVTFRYLDGERFVEAVRRAHGERAVDNLFIHPPSTSQQILHPEEYFAGRQPPEITIDQSALDSLGWNLSTSTSMGEVGMRGILLAHNPERDALRLASNWRGDRAFLFERPKGQTLFVWKSVWSGEVAAEEFLRRFSLTSGPNTRSETAIHLENGLLEISGKDSGFMIARKAGGSVIIVRGNESDVRRVMEQLTL